MTSTPLQKFFSPHALLWALFSALFFFLIAFNNLTWELLFLGIGAAILFLLFSKRLHLLLALVPITPIIGEVFTLNILDRWKYEITFAEILLIFLAFAFLINTILHASWKHVRIPRLGVILLGLLAFEALSVFWMTDIAKYLVAIRILVFHLAGFFLVLNIARTKEHITLMVNAFLAAAALISAQLLLELRHVGTFTLLFHRELVRTNIGPLAFVVAIIVLLLPIAFTALLKKRTLWQHTLAWSAATLGTTAALFTLGRAALMSFLVGIFYLVWRLRWKKIGAVAIIVLLLIVTVFISQSTLFEHFFLRWRTIFSDISNTFRVQEMRTGLSLFLKHPLFGVGAGNIKYWYPTIIKDYDQESNNFIVQILAEFGVIGFIFLSLIAWQCMTMIRHIHRSRTFHEHTSYRLRMIGLETSIVVAALHGLVEATFFGLHYGILFWMLVGLLYAAQGLGEKK